MRTCRSRPSAASGTHAPQSRAGAGRQWSLEKSDRRAPRSASAHEMDDLELVVRCKVHHGEGRAVAQNGSVALDDDRPRVESQGTQEISDRESGGNAPLGTVHLKRNLSNGGFPCEAARHNLAAPEKAAQTA